MASHTDLTRLINYRGPACARCCCNVFIINKENMRTPDRPFALFGLDVKINIKSIIRDPLMIVQAGGRKEARCNPSSRLGLQGCNA